MRYSRKWALWRGIWVICAVFESSSVPDLFGSRSSWRSCWLSRRSLFTSVRMV